MIVDLVQRSGPVSSPPSHGASTWPSLRCRPSSKSWQPKGISESSGVGEASHSGGRRPVLYEFNQASHHVLGVHIGVETTTAVLADARGHEVARTEVVTSREAPAEVLASSALRSAASSRSVVSPGVTLLLSGSARRRSSTPSRACWCSHPTWTTPCGEFCRFRPALRWHRRLGTNDSRKGSRHQSETDRRKRRPTDAKRTRTRTGCRGPEK